MLAVEFFFFGFSMIDYSNERRKMTTGESTKYVMANKSLAVANGGVFHFLLLIPVIGIMVGPTYGVVAATLASHETSPSPPTHPLQ
jgi:CysZ protein